MIYIIFIGKEKREIQLLIETYINNLDSVHIWLLIGFHFIEFSLQRQIFVLDCSNDIASCRFDKTSDTQAKYMDIGEEICPFALFQLLECWFK